MQASVPFGCHRVPGLKLILVASGPPAFLLPPEKEARRRKKLAASHSISLPLDASRPSRPSEPPRILLSRR